MARSSSNENPGLLSREDILDAFALFEWYRQEINEGRCVISVEQKLLRSLDGRVRIIGKAKKRSLRNLFSEQLGSSEVRVPVFKS